MEVAMSQLSYQPEKVAVKTAYVYEKKKS